MIKVNDKKTAIVGSIVGLVILLTVFSSKGNKEEAPVVEATPVEEVVPAAEEVTPAESAE